MVVTMHVKKNLQINTRGSDYSCFDLIRFLIYALLLFFWRFHTIAYLKQIWWLEVEGDIDFDFPPGNYSLYFRLYLGKVSPRQIQHGSFNNDQVHGWAINPVCFRFWVSNGEHAMSKHFLNEQGKWICYHVGDFLVDHDCNYESTKIKFSMTQIDCTHQKGGLSLDSVLVCPRELETCHLVWVTWVRASSLGSEMEHLWFCIEKTCLWIVLLVSIIAVYHNLF